MSDTNRSQLYVVEESQLGTTPGSALSELRFTSESLGVDKQTTMSEEVRNDRQTTDIITTGESVGGAVNFEMSYGSYDTLLPGALFSGDWPSQLTVTDTDISAANSDSSFNSAGAGFPAFVPGQWIKVSGFTGDDSNNGYHQVVSRTTSKIVVTSTLVDDTAGESVTIHGTMIRNGTTRKSYTLEKQFADITQFQSFTGMCVDGLSLNVSSNSVLAGNFDFVGLQGALTQSTVGTGGPNAANTNPVMNASSNVGTLHEGEAALASNIFISQIEANIANNLRGNQAIGSLPAIDIGVGSFSVTGTLNVYFVNNALFDKYMAGTTTALSWVVEDASGNGYAFTAPRIKFVDGNILTRGRNQDVMAEMAWEASMHSTYGNMFQIDRFPAA